MTASGGAAETVAESAHELLELLDLQRIRILVDAEQAGHIVVVEVLRHRFVGDEHELLDDPVRDVALERDDRLDHALVVQHDFRLLQIEVDRPAPVPPAVEDLEQRVHPLEERDQLGVPGDDLRIAIGQDGVDLGVGHARVAVNHPVVKLVAHDGPLPVDLHQAGLHQPIDVRIEAAQAGGELGREHVHGPLGKIHRSGPVVAFFVERAALRHVMGHVGDVHAEPVVAVRRAGRA